MNNILLELTHKALQHPKEIMLSSTAFFLTSVNPRIDLIEGWMGIAGGLLSLCYLALKVERALKERKK